MNLKEILEQSPVWVMIVIATGAFFVGVTVTIGIIKILFQDQSKKISTMENLKRFPVLAIIFIFVFGFIAGVGIMRILDRDQPETKIETDRSSILENLDRKYGQQTANINKSIKNSDLFRVGNPIPIGFEQIKVGMRLSVLQSIFPNGHYTIMDSFGIDIKDNKLIQSIYCRVNYDDENMNDGTITGLTFYFKDSAAREYVIKQALSVFGSGNAIGKLRGNVLEWENVGGFHVTIDQNFYNVENAK